MVRGQGADGVVRFDRAHTPDFTPKQKYTKEELIDIMHRASYAFQLGPLLTADRKDFHQSFKTVWTTRKNAVTTDLRARYSLAEVDHPITRAAAARALEEGMNQGH